SKNAPAVTAELQAIVFALEWLIQRPRQMDAPIRGRIVHTFWVVTDSMKAPQRLGTWQANFSGQYLVKRAQDLIVRIEVKGATVKFLWVPAHSGVAGNEAAHRAAQETTTA
ncbi:hypothetical protein B0J12DRAFT_553558, partial [Macrophomina phaseolina]